MIAAALSAIALAVGLAATPPAVAAPAAPAVADIGIGTYRAMLVDDARRQVFVGGDAGIAVFGFDGTGKASLPIPATAFALHDDVLYVASGHSIKRIDTGRLRQLSALVSGRRDVGAMAWAGNRLWFYDDDGTGNRTSDLYSATVAGQQGSPVLTGQSSFSELVTAPGRPNVIWSTPLGRGCAGTRLVVNGDHAGAVTRFPDLGFFDCGGFAVSPAGDKATFGTESDDGVVEVSATTMRPDGVSYPRAANEGGGRYLTSFGSPAAPLLVSWYSTFVYPPPPSGFDVYPWGGTTLIRHIDRPYTRDVAGSADGRMLFFVQGSGPNVRTTSFHAVTYRQG